MAHKRCGPASLDQFSIMTPKVAPVAVLRRWRSTLASSAVEPTPAEGGLTHEHARSARGISDSSHHIPVRPRRKPPDRISTQPQPSSVAIQSPLPIVYSSHWPRGAKSCRSAPAITALDSSASLAAPRNGSRPSLVRRQADPGGTPLVLLRQGPFSARKPAYPSRRKEAHEMVT